MKKEQQDLLSLALLRISGILTETIRDDPNVEAVVIMAVKDPDNQQKRPEFSVATCPPNPSPEHLAYLLRCLLDDAEREIPS